MDRNQMFTRRTFLAAGAAASTLAALGPSLLRAAVGSAVNAQQGNVSDHIAVLQASDPNFESELDRLFPGLRQDPNFSSIQSHAVLITNIGKKKIRAHSTCWTVTTPSGEFKATRLHYFHPRGKRHHTVHFGCKGNKTRFTGKVALLKPGTTRLLTPYFNWTPKHYLTRPAPDWQSMLTATKSRRLFAEKLSNATNIKVKVDAVILNRKVIIGPDSGHLGRVYRKTRNAEHDEAVKILNLIKAGASHHDIVKRLHIHAKMKRPKGSPAKGDHVYLYARKRQAKVLLRRLRQAMRRGKPEQFVRTLNYLKKQRRTTTGMPIKSVQPSPAAKQKGTTV